MATLSKVRKGRTSPLSTVNINKVGDEIGFGGQAKTTAYLSRTEGSNFMAEVGEDKDGRSRDVRILNAEDDEDICGAPLILCLVDVVFDPVNIYYIRWAKRVSI